VFPRGDTMNGIFYSLKIIDGSFLSQYSVETTINQGSKESIYDYPSTSADSYFIANDGILKIKFKTPFVLTDYSFANSGSTQQSHSHPRSWNIYGTGTNGKSFLLDTRTDFTFCNNMNECSNSEIKTFHAKRLKVVNDITINQTASSSGAKYFILRSLEIFGMFCHNSHICYALSKKTVCEKRRNIHPLFVNL